MSAVEGLVGGLRHYRGINEITASLLFNYLAIARRNILTLVLMLATCSPDRALAGTPEELGARK